MTWRSAVDGVLSALFEPPCAACQGRLDHPLDGAVCDACWSAVQPVTPPVCRSCALPLPSWRVASLLMEQCPRCRRSPGAVDRLAAVGAYEGALRAIVHALKYGQRRSVAPRLSALMRVSGADVLAGAAVVVPVPLHPRRQWARGFNQAEDLARGLGLPVTRPLRRVVATSPQVGLPAAQRHRNVRRAFVMARPVPRWRRGGASPHASVQGRIVVLVDDVVTTGATVEACARVLKAAGAIEVRALTAARAVTARP